MVKKYFMTREAARKYAISKNISTNRVMATSSIWQKKDKRRSRKNYVIKW